MEGTAFILLPHPAVHPLSAVARKASISGQISLGALLPPCPPPQLQEVDIHPDFYIPTTHHYVVSDVFPDLIGIHYTELSELDDMSAQIQAFV